jgi:prepilin-type N-terminal cleavage/methylation domain-containing protein
MKRYAKKRRRAFTLIEIMVASVIMVILVGLVIQITTQVLNVWNKSSGKLSANAEARIALDLLTQDLETAVFRNNGKQWLRVDADASAASGGPYSNQTVALKLFSPALDRDQSAPGDVCAIGYHLRFGPAYENASDNVYALYRMLIDPETTFNTYMGSSSDAVQDLLTGAPGWDKSSIVSDENYLAGNIIDFKVLLYEEDSVNGTARLINASSDLELEKKSFFYGGTGDGLIGEPLLYAEVILRVISNEGLQLLQRFDDVGAFEQYQTASDIVRLHGETFTRRVNFLAQPL